MSRTTRHVDSRVTGKCPAYSRACSIPQRVYVSPGDEARPLFPAVDRLPSPGCDTAGRTSSTARRVSGHFLTASDASCTEFKCQQYVTQLNAYGCACPAETTGTDECRRQARNGQIPSKCGKDFVARHLPHTTLFAACSIGPRVSPVHVGTRVVTSRFNFVSCCSVLWVHGRVN